MVMMMMLMMVMMMVLMMVMSMNMMMMMVKLWELCYKKAANSNRQLLSPFSLPSVVTRRYHHHHPRRHLLAYIKLILKITIADPIKLDSIAISLFTIREL